MSTRALRNCRRLRSDQFRELVADDWDEYSGVETDYGDSEAEQENDGDEIPILTMEDIRNELIQEARQNIARGADQRALWVRGVDAFINTLFHIVLLRILKNLFSMTSFSKDILKDTEEFISMIVDKTPGFNFMSNLRFSSGAGGAVDAASSVGESIATGNTTLIMRFGYILAKEFPSWESYPNSMIAMTLLSFYCYTLVASLFLITSFVFSMLCMTYSIGRRWHTIQTFIVGLFKENAGTF
ncbi:unnamed protein product [Kuraishia capsulata CBS 1993]|uniref:Uncharacterized protein n=1 Tax=Kuraishia capsulata CBS 1993 TaxID=1382522 RepID=W6MSZ3_9ASCO|nr:uncharacterized protein KUCA_T00005476001 [Kuraishia capsulata CBS 1993]CDK29488.1 unnamed protein product [Kuraishia capsulata CBS 1993]